MRWSDRIGTEEAAELVRAALAEGWIDGDAVLVHDLVRMRDRIGLLRAAWPGAVHALAIKANPVVGVLRAAVRAGAGLEAASIEEVHLALAAGCPPERVVYDSPAKTVAELREALALGLVVNADNAAELERIADLGPRSGIGLRVNPAVGAGRIAATSTAARSSKFGVPIDEAEALLRRFAFVDGVHVHVGSQGCSLDLLAGAARVADDLRARFDQIRWIDVGGGLPVAYPRDEVAPSVEDWVAALRAAAPGLDRVDVITELGRAIQAPCGFAVSRVEHVKRAGDATVAVVHVGADLLVRAAYAPADWWHEISVLDPSGAPKQGSGGRITIAGPLCFSGDLIARDRELPPVEPGDWVVVHDTGAYTLAMWSRHCSRGIPRVLGRTARGFRVLRERERPDDVVRFWS